ncbi:hypothetical protein AALB19_01490 [Oscillospiraceae bacterium 50-58]
MLIHKTTMGVLERIWTGQHTRRADGTLSPLDRPAVLSDVDDPENWWEIPSRGALAQKIRRYYPFLRPVVDGEGGLVEVVPLCSEEDQEAAERAREVKTAMTQEAARRGYRKAGKVRPLGLMPFLSCTPPCNKAGSAEE